MSKKEAKNCRLCLETLDDDYNVIEEITREIFQILLLKVDLSVSKEPVVCKSCMECIQEAFKFKSSCIFVDEQVVTLAIDRNAAELDIRDVYLNENENKGLAFSEDYNICRFCLQCQNKNNFNLLSDLRSNLFDQMLLKCIPELDLNIIKESVVCAVCIKSLETYYSFALKCQNTEGNIMKYCEVQGAERSGQINLFNVQIFQLKILPQCNSNCNKMDAFEGDNDLFQNRVDTCSDLNKFELKIEELVIEDESKVSNHKTKKKISDEKKGKAKDEPSMVILENFLEKHMLVHRSNTKLIYKCNICSYETKDRARLKIHMLVHMDSSKVTMHRCEECTFATRHKVSLLNHMLMHKDNSEVTMHKCNLCSYETKRKGNLTKHIKLTHKKSSEKYRCEKCTFETMYNGSLKDHMLIHKDDSEVTKYTCNFCSYKAKRKNNLKKHMLSHQNSSTVKYRCERCTFETRYKGSLNDHMRIHKDSSEVIMYKCNLCDYESKWKTNLRDHMLNHHRSSDAEIYKCASCTFETKCKKSLRNHMLIHRNNAETTMYKCNLCSYEAKIKSYIGIHMLVHKKSSDVVMFKCASCTFETKYKGSLINHMTVHKRYFRCEVCNFKAKHKGNLKKHMLIHKNTSELTENKDSRR